MGDLEKGVKKEPNSTSDIDDRILDAEIDGTRLNSSQHDTAFATKCSSLPRNHSPGYLRAKSYRRKVKDLPYDTKGIAEDFESNDDVVDVVVIEQASSSSTISHHIQSIEKLRAFLETVPIDQAPPPNDSDGTQSYILLVNDLSSPMIELLGGYLRIPPQVFTQHMSSGENIRHNHQAISKPCLLGCPGYKRGIKATRPVYTNNANLHACTWWRLSYYDLETHRMARGLNRHWSEERVAWKRLGLPPLPENEGYHSQWRWVKERVCRPYHAITEVEDDQWGCAAEEQVTFFESPGYPNISIILFDKQRNLQHKKHGSIVIDRPLFASQDEWGCDPGDLASFQFDGHDDNPNTEMERKISPSFGTRDFFLALMDEARSQLGDGSKSFRTAAYAKQLFLGAVLRMWRNVTSRMGMTLDDIDRAVGDDILVSTRLSAWTKLLSSWRCLLVDFHEKSMENTRLLRSTSTSGDCALQEELTEGFAALDKARKRLEERVERTSQALMSAMSIIESKNAIVQTESIGKLTEMATIFIPLSFASSFFGMDIKEWQNAETKPRMAYFWTLGLGLLLAVYGMRLAIRSQPLKTLFDHLNEHAATMGRVSAGQEISNSVWFRTIWKFAWSTPLIWCSLALLLAFLPLGIIWSQFAESHWELWHCLLASQLVVGIFCFFAQSVTSGARGPCRTVLVATMVVGIPASLLWTCNPELPRYTALTGTACCAFLFLTLRHLLYDKFGHISRMLASALCAVYLQIYPALTIWEGRISAFDGSPRGWKITITILATVVMCAIVVLHWMLVCSIARCRWHVGPISSWRRRISFLGYTVRVFIY